MAEEILKNNIPTRAYDPNDLILVENNETGRVNKSAISLGSDPTYYGNGSPEGVVSASQGSVYRDNSATFGAVVWTKYSGGSGNTGWRVTDGDTGQRTVMLWSGGAITYNPLGASFGSQMQQHATFDGGIFVRRVGHISYLWMKNVTANINLTALSEYYLVNFLGGWPAELNPYISQLGDTPMSDSTRIAFMPQPQFDRIFIIPRADISSGDRVATYAAEIASFPTFGSAWPTSSF